MIAKLLSGDLDYKGVCMILKKDGSLIKKFSVVLCLSLVLNCIFVPRVYAADAATYRTGLAPLETLVAAVVIGSGIVAGQSQQAVDALVSSVSKVIKDNTVRKAEEDPAFETPYRVIQGGGSGSDPTPEEPNDNNKNGRWFGIVGASSLGSALLFEKGAIEEIMQTIKNQNGYNSSYAPLGVFSASDMISTSNASNISLQLANYSNNAVSQFDKFLHSDFWNNKDFTPDDCLFSVGVRVANIFSTSVSFPEVNVNVMVNNGSIDSVRLTGNPFANGFFTNSIGSLSYIYCTTHKYDPVFLDSNLSSPNIREFFVNIPANNGNFSYSAGPANYVQSYKTFGNSNEYAYAGYKWLVQNPWTFTNNVYNPDQTFTVNFPDWVQQSITLLGKQIDAVNLGLQNLSKINWAQTQPQIQTSPASDAAVSQAVNNWENPGNIPEPEPNPNPDPDPDPEPQPVPEPVPNDEYLGNFLLPESITTKFPFCIPFDVARCLRLFSISSREAPRWECDLGYGSSSYHVVIDLSVFNDVADFIRPLEYILFLVGLAVGTRALIRG